MPTSFNVPDHQKIGNRVNFTAWLNNLRNNDIGWFTNAGAPTNGTSGTLAGFAGIGSLLEDTTNKNLYVNTGTRASPTWTTTALNGAAGSVTSAMLTPGLVQFASGVIASADITGTGAGQLGHANGVILVANGGAGVLNELISCQVTIKFSVAAYTGGGNTTINIGGGGAALTGLISAANFIQQGADKTIVYNPLSTAPNVYTTNNPLNLVTTAAPTQPGTAAGTIRWNIAYRVISGL